ncbi:diguanylate cyclase domain-containing protein [Egicoccus sp. AB-alg6-2]|uniref:diguanylate cyclase domain-containing protein n=1 Tax=Egicoccus sp. AB-alg6-2 TaxID=3242692 RepID=UPI00359F0AEE
MRSATPQVMTLLPDGRSLPAEQWRARHEAIVRGILAAVVPVAALMWLAGDPLAHVLVGAGVPLTLAILARFAPGSMRLRATGSALALMCLVVLVVHTTGTIEAHFLFFVAVPILALYEDWPPFLTSIFVVLFHHGLAGLLDPAAVYNHAAALQDPLGWGLVHAALFLAMCVVSVVHWAIHERTRARLTQAALHDGLTGLPNRRLLLEQLRRALADRAERGVPAALLMLDVDGFKPVNDTFGHGAGDALLVELAARFRDAVRPTDTVARLGGDEFAFVLIGAAAEDAIETARRLVVLSARPVMVGERAIEVGASVGIAVASVGTTGALQLLDQADIALRTAKRNGRATSVLFASGLDQAGSEALPVVPHEARAWSRYMAALREEIGARKRDGALAAQTRAPDSVHRTLGVLTSEIGELPPDLAQAHLPLPDRAALEEFVFHQSMVHDWADSLVAAGVLTTRRCADADRFWAALVASLGRGRAPDPHDVADHDPDVREAARSL